MTFNPVGLWAGSEYCSHFLCVILALDSQLDQSCSCIYDEDEFVLNHDQS